MTGVQTMSGGPPTNPGGNEAAPPETVPDSNAATWWKVAGVSIDRSAAVAIVINRGTEASIIEFVVRDGPGGPAELLRAKQNPVTIEIGAPDIKFQPIVLRLENWWITAIEPSDPGFFRVVVRDCRCAESRQDRRPTLAFNIYDSRQGRSDVPRAATLDNGQPWTCYRAAQRAIEACGLKFEPTPVEQSATVTLLPRNLGDSQGGGFPALDWERDMPLLTEPAQLDMVVLPNGNVTLADRFTEAAVGLKNHVPLAGFIAPRDLHWSLPKVLVIKVEQRIERVFLVDDSLTAASGNDLAAVNVIGRQLPSLEPQVLFFEPLFEYMQSRWGKSPATIRQRMFKPRVIEENENDSDRTTLDKHDAELALREHWRSTYRVQNDQGLATVVDMTIGHLGADGTTRSERSVYMGYCFMRRNTRISSRGINAASLAKIPLTDNVALSLTRPAPFLAALGYDQKGDVLFRLKPQPVSEMMEIYPGELAVPVALGDALALSGPATYLSSLAPDAEYKAGWFAYVVYHALLVADRPDLGLKRMHEITRPLFPEGAVDRAEYFVRDMTANWTLPAPNATRLTLANVDELNARADEIQRQVLAAFQPGRAGPFVTGGVDAVVTGKFWVRGNIRSLTILLGATAPHTVEIQWLVMPGVRPVYTDDMVKAMQGPPIRELA